MTADVPAHSVIDLDNFNAVLSRLCLWCWRFPCLGDSAQLYLAFRDRGAKLQVEAVCCFLHLSHQPMSMLQLSAVL
jgi:hypothetical protein